MTGDPKAEHRLKGHILNYIKEEGKLYGRIKKIYHFSQDIPDLLLSYTMYRTGKNGIPQVASFPKEVLMLKKAELNVTREVIAFRDYLLMEIERIRSGPRNEETKLPEGTIIFKTMYKNTLEDKHLDETKAARKFRRNQPEKIRKILEYWQNLKLIKTFQFSADGEYVRISVPLKRPCEKLTPQAKELLEE